MWVSCSAQVRENIISILVLIARQIINPEKAPGTHQRLRRFFLKPVSTPDSNTPDSPGEMPFEGFDSLIRKPLEKHDPVSFSKIKRIFIDVPTRESGPFRMLLLRLSGKSMNETEAKSRWIQILAHKHELEEKLERVVGVQTATVDYFDILSNPRESLKSPQKMSYKDLDPKRSERSEAPWLERAYSPGYHLERLREEMQRARRYRHSLSAIMLDIDNFHKVNETLSADTGDRVLTAVVDIVKHTIRTVDIIARYSGDRFLVILPNTNKREAVELAERIRRSIRARTRRIPGISQGVTATVAVNQCGQGDSSIEFLKLLEGQLLRGKQTARDAVYTA